MTCREFVEFLDEYLSGELPGSVRSDFELHLEGCADCMAYLRSYEETIRLAKAIGAEPESSVPEKAPEELIRAILAAYAKSV
ncbi:MAG TPA: zf-HC2 domain-containing protein [Isosphaeraceae bacterium]|jgi:anti-sigma factor RsiW